MDQDEKWPFCIIPRYGKSARQFVDHAVTYA
jgi:hypothetical protein